MLRRTEGIVLRTTPFGEADLIVTYLTNDFGLIKVFAKSPRKIKSRFGSSLEPLTQSVISFWGKEDTSLSRLTQADIIHPFKFIRETLNCFMKVTEIIEITLNFLPERDANRNVYLLLLNTLHAVEKNISLSSSAKTGRKAFSGDDIILSHYKIKFLSLSGFAPKLDSCGRCGNKGTSFYIAHGTVLCEMCAKGIDSPVKISPAVLKLYTDLITWDTMRVHRIKPSAILLRDLSHIISAHTKYILTKPLKSEAFNPVMTQ